MRAKFGPLFNRSTVMSSNRMQFAVAMFFEATRGARLGALAAICALSMSHAFNAGAAEIDRGFGGGYGYVPVAAFEPVSDIVAAVVREADDRVVVLGRRLVAGRGVLFLQRYSREALFDETFGDQGTVTIDIAGVSLSPRDLLLQPTGRLIVVAESATVLRLLAFLPTGQPDTTFGISGEAQVNLNAGIAAGTTTAHLVTSFPAANAILLIMPGTPSASLGLTLYRFTIDGKVDQDFGIKGKQALLNLGTGLAFSGVAAGLPDGRFIVAASATSAADPTRTLFALTKDGVLDTVGFGVGGIASPAVLQGKAIQVVAPLFNNYFVVAANNGSLATLNRFDPAGRLDTQFGAAGTVRVEPAGGGNVSIQDVFEQVDNNIIVTGSVANSLFVGRYLQRGIVDPTFNAGKGPQVVQDPGSNVTRGVLSVSFEGSQLLHFGNGIPFGAAATSPTAASRAFFISTTDGVLDANYAGKGIVSLFGRKPPYGEFPNQVLPLADGRIVVLAANGADQGLLGSLSRFLPDGTADATFGINGRTTFKQNGQCEWPMTMALQPDGRIVVLGTSFDALDCDRSAMFGKRFDVNGQPEAYALFYGSANQRARSGGIAMQADSKSVITGQDDRSMTVARFLQTGGTDTNFGPDASGRVLWNRSANDLAKGGAVVVQADQKIVAAGSLNGTHLVLLRLLPSGAYDPTFGTAGVSLTEVTSSGFLDVQAVKLTVQGRVLMLARLGQRPLLAQFTSTGALDTSFGNAGLLQLPLYVGGSQYSRYGLAVQSDGGIVVSGQTTDTPASSMALMRLLANGQPDTQFGPAGILQYRPSVYFAAGATALAAIEGSSNLLAGGYGLPGALLVKIRNPIVAGTVVEFYNTILNHYFITADPAEQAAVDAGAAGPGWTRTGQGFRVYTNALGVPLSAIPVCRFYGSTVINPATGQRRGPNSHFYTAVPEECAAVKTDPGWTFESIAFFTNPTLASNTCAAGTVPVYRVYNNRPQFNDSNHRYTTDFAIYQLMQSMGFRPEGIVFCAASG